MLRCLLLLLSFCCAAWASPELRNALSQYEAGDYATSRKSSQAILLSGRGDELEAALYLLTRIDLAEKNGEQAVRGAERLVRAFPDGEYYPYARFALAEALFLTGEIERSHGELQWCADSSRDSRLKERAIEILAERAEFAQADYLFPADGAARDREALGNEHRAHVVLLLSFPDANDTAPQQLDQAFTFASQELDAFDCEVWHAGSAFGAVQALDSAAQNEVDLVVFAGDEGSATALALANSAHSLPILKITSTPRSMAVMCESMVEFLPSQETMAGAAAKYAALELGVRHGILLTPDSDVGRAHRDGFARIKDFGVSVDADHTYPADAGNVRRELYDVLSAPARLERGGDMVDALLSREEREKLFGGGGAGEVSVQAANVNEQDSATASGTEVFYFSLQSEQVNNFCSQLGNLPRGMLLVGNSGWLDERSLIAQATITRNMLITAPLLPQADRHTELYLALDEHNDFDLTAWELLGIDAADFVSAVLTEQLARGADFVQAARDVGYFRGAAVHAEIGANGENRMARILKFDGETLMAVK